MTQNEKNAETPADQEGKMVVRIQLNGELAQSFKTLISASGWKYEVIDQGLGTYVFHITVRDAMDAYRLGRTMSKVFTA